MNEICSLQTLPAKKIFAKGFELFFDKWSDTSDEFIKLLKYFQKQKIDSNEGWYEALKVKILY